MTITAATGDTLIERGITSTRDFVRVYAWSQLHAISYQEPSTFCAVWVSTNLA